MHKVISPATINAHIAEGTHLRGLFSWVTLNTSVIYSAGLLLRLFEVSAPSQGHQGIWSQEVDLSNSVS